MFASTLDYTESFLRSICCDQCHQSSDKLQFIGSSCKHVFCWTCVNVICDRNSYPLCPQCLLPVGLQHVKSAAFANQLFQNLLSLKEALTKFTVSQCDRQIILDLIETCEQRRTVEEFCSTQECARIKSDGGCIVANGQLEEMQAAHILSNDVLRLCSLSDHITPPTQTEDVAGTSDQNGILLAQQMRAYNEPRNFQSFKEPPRNTFYTTIAGKKFAGSKRKLKSRRSKNSDAIPLITATPRNSHKSLSQRYEYNLVNAAIRGSKTRLLKALKDGEDVNECDNLGLTALYHAAAHNYTEICKILIENGALINAHGGELCETALHAAVRWKATNAIMYLLSKGANRRARNLKDETPMDFIKDEEIRAIFGRISYSVQIAYPFRKLKKYSVFLSTTLPDAKLECGKLLLTNLSKYTANFETASHVVVQVVKDQTAEITIEILEAMLRGQYILTGEWLDACLQANDVVDEEMYEITKINRNGQLLAANSCSTARKNHARMNPELFRGCHFYFCKHKYLPYKENEIKKLVKLAGGVILGREPKAEEYVESGLRPYHARRKGNDFSELSGLFAVYMPGQSIPQRVAKQKFIRFITPVWIMECIAHFTLLEPDDR